ncbi:MAG TPA: DUF6242 domain-containing protein, partial [Paludibacteraceae bacterium]|nr:DUF6242 domain-containing protein [Paludibacteraceae bacterium]
MNPQKILIVLLIITAIFASSCTKTEDTTPASSNTTITKFSLKSASTNGLSKATFTIDNDNNLIYNVDSLPYLSDVDSLIPSIFGGTLSAIYLNDTIRYTGKDTLDFRNPIKITTIATDK